MTIKELEEQLNISRANIRFYEKECLLSPDRKENKYRDYSAEDIVRLQKIIILRKLGVSVADIKNVLDGTKPLQEIIHKNTEILSEKIKELNGALDVCIQMEKEQVDIQSFNEDYYWNMIQTKEKNGQSFAEICKDVFDFEIDIFGMMCKYVFFHDFKGSTKKHGLKWAFIIVLTMCIIRGLSKQFIWKSGSFWEGFFYPFILFAAATVIFLPIYLLKNKHPKLAYVLSNFLLIVGITFLVAIFLLIFVLVLNSWIHFWF